MNTPTTLDDEIITKLKDSGEYELNRSKSKYDKRKSEIETFLAKHEAEERLLESTAFRFHRSGNVEEYEATLQKITAKQDEATAIRNERETIKIVLNRIDKILDELVAKNNQDKILKYLKSQGYTTLEQVKAALSKNH